ncbi:MAG: ABC transporter permease [Oscillospiraceae bacterium]|nr:ABC transporter permease [Oscillospiraceae bacterium]
MEDRISLGRICKLLCISAKMDLVWLLRDTKYALIGILGDMINNIATLSGIFLIVARFNGLSDMTSDEVLFMMAYNTLITGIFILFGSSNNIHVSRIIGRGQLEHLFIQPLSLGIQLTTSGFAPFTGSGNLVVGILLMVIATNRLNLHITFMWLLLLMVYLICTMVIIIARSYLVSSLAFYAPVAAEEISSTAIDDTYFISTFPLTGMPKALQLILVSILPEGLMAWYPSLSLLGRPPLNLSGFYPMFFALFISLVASYFFKKGLTYYVKKGSNRYVPYGFRR